VVAGNGGGLSIARPIAAGISYVGDNRLVMPQSTGNHCGRHAPSSPFRLQCFIMHCGVRTLDETRQQGGQRSSRWRLGEFPGHHIHCFRRCDVSKIQTTYAVRDREHPAVRLYFLPRPGEKCPHGIFVDSTQLPWVSRLTKDYVQHEGSPLGM
jgi:hypothetical protein